MRLWRNKKGFTLIELVIGMALTVMLIALAGSILLTAMNVLGRTTQQEAAQGVGEVVYDFYEACLADATAVSLGAAGGNNEALTIVDGRVYYSRDEQAARDIYGDGVYNGLQVRVTPVPTSAHVLQLTVEVMDSRGEVLFTRQSAFRLNSLNRLDKEIADEVVGDDYTNAAVYFTNHS